MQPPILVNKKCGCGRTHGKVSTYTFWPAMSTDTHSTYLFNCACGSTLVKKILKVVLTAPLHVIKRNDV